MYGYECGYPAYPAYGYGGCGNSNWFALIVVLFILLIIIGACYNYNCD
ncbi:YjcZ family sporulation protein [Mangrovibacillus cuniculi]|uniref:YjcZ family sporulation protein n=1 Tax=Mangrovibacillus cuniculi TaxID=2593652 RepID=A0A7S8HFA4_9BACI|nr:YjcZ family sporulation protein [Mangrovibacillus cuniculi]QPC46613.1 YjcZ family sporulation protein [Mangrovibacillus cuniculi]